MEREDLEPLDVKSFVVHFWKLVLGVTMTVDAAPCAVSLFPASFAAQLHGGSDNDKKYDEIRAKLK